MGRADLEPDAFSRVVDWPRVWPFLALHVLCIGVLWVGVSPVAVAVAVALYVLRMFAITAFYHRYFAHRAFRTSRPAQLVFAMLGNAAVQRGPLWWASHHRRHHALADRRDDLHSPRWHGFWWSHVGWFLTREAYPSLRRRVRDLERFPELVLLDRFDWLVPLLLVVGLFALGEGLAAWAPGLGTDGWQLVVWGFGVSTVVLYHATFAINSLGHVFGRRRFATNDDSRNSWSLALLTLGEGWHNNHHRFPGLARQGLRAAEIDVTYWGLLVLRRLGVISHLRLPRAGSGERRQREGRS